MKNPKPLAQPGVWMKDPSGHVCFVSRKSSDPVTALLADGWEMADAKVVVPSAPVQAAVKVEPDWTDE